MAEQWLGDHAAIGSAPNGGNPTLWETLAYVGGSRPETDEREG